MNVYGVLSEVIETHHMSWDPPEPPEYGCIYEIVVAETHSAAKYLALKKERHALYDPLDWPRCTVRKLGTAEGPARVMAESEAQAWHEKASILKTPA